MGRPASPVAPEERCDLCSASIPADHRHLLHIEERRIVCTCETCRALFAGDGPYRPAGSRTVWLDGFELPDELWASFRIPIGLAFFFRAARAGGVVAFYPSPAGTTECELDLGAWEELVAANPVLDGLETDAEALIVNRLGGARQHAIVPIDECYRLVGLVRVSWEGISGGAGDRDRRGRLLRGAAGEGGVTESSSSDARVLPAARTGARGRRRRGGALRRCADAPSSRFARTSPPAARCTPSRSRRRSTSIPGSGRTATRRASSSSISSATPDRWAATTTSIVWARVDVLVPSFTSTTEFTVPVPVQLRPRGGRDQVPLRAAGRGGAAQLPLQRPDLLPRRRRPDAGRAGSVESRPRSGCRWRRGGG